MPTTQLILPRNLRPSVTDILCSKYEVLEFLDLFDYDLNPASIGIAMNKFKHVKLRPYQRIIALHHDTDYYYSFNVPGNNVYNLLVACNLVNFPLKHMILLTNHYGIKSEVEKAAMDLCGNSDIKVEYTSQWFDYPESEHYDDRPNFDFNLEKTYTCLNGAPRSHRLLTMCMLKEYDLLDDGFITFNNL